MDESDEVVPALRAPADLALHRSVACAARPLLKQACPRGPSNLEEHFQKHKDDWQTKLPVHPDHPHLGSWLAALGTGSSFRTICKVCAKDGRPISQARFCVGFSGSEATGQKQLTLQACKQHAVSKSHLEAVARLLNKDSQSLSASFGVLTTELVMNLWKEFAGGASFRKLVGNEDWARHHQKVARVHWCLSQALLDQDREFLKQALVIAIHQDGRGGKHLMRYSACLPDMSVRKGILALDFTPGTTGHDLAQCMEHSLCELSTLRDGSLDVDLLRALQNRVEMLNADGGPDEVRALRLTTMSGADSNVIFPNCKLRLKDVTHAARRLTKNPWSVDPYLADVYDTFVQSPNSIVNLIKNSPDLQQLFGAMVSDDDKTPFDPQTRSRIKSLKYAPHRFESHMRPLSRLVTLFESVWGAAIEISVRRTGGPQARAKEFLRACSAERLLQLALLADAGTVSLDLVRHFDSEQTDISEASGAVQEYLHALDSMFLEGDVLYSGHTFHMLQTLERQRTCILDGQTKVLGGPKLVSSDMVKRCLARMAAWVRLCVGRIEAEMPHWHIMRAFQVFDIRSCIPGKLGLQDTSE